MYVSIIHHNPRGSSCYNQETNFCLPAAKNNLKTQLWKGALLLNDKLGSLWESGTEFSWVTDCKYRSISTVFFKARSSCLSNMHLWEIVWPQFSGESLIGVFKSSSTALNAHARLLWPLGLNAVWLKTRIKRHEWLNTTHPCSSVTLLKLPYNYWQLFFDGWLFILQVRNSNPTSKAARFVKFVILGIQIVIEIYKKNKKIKSMFVELL